MQNALCVYEHLFRIELLPVAQVAHSLNRVLRTESLLESDSCSVSIRDSESVISLQNL